MTILSIVNIALTYWFPAREFNWGLTWSGMISGPFMFVVYLALLQLVLPKRYRLDARRLGLMYAFIMGSVCLTHFRVVGIFIYAISSLRIQEPYKTQWMKWAPEPGLYSPSEAVISLMLKGGSPIPSEWIAPLLFWMAFFFSATIQGMGVMLLLRRQWIEVEELTFPYAVMISDFSRTFTEPWEISSKRKLKKSSKYILIGMLIGWIWYLPLILRQVAPLLTLPWFAGPYMWLGGAWPWVPWNPGTFDLFHAIPAIGTIAPGVYTLNFNPLWWILAIIAPPSITLSTSLCWIIFLILLPTLFYYTGLYPPEVALSADTHTFYYFIAKAEPLKIYAFMGVGVATAIAVVPFLFNWRRWGHILLTMVGKRKMTDEEARSEPLHPRWPLIMIIIGTILQIVFMSVVGASPVSTFVGIVLGTIYGLACARAAGEFGCKNEIGDFESSLYYNLLYPNVTWDNMTKEFFVSNMMYGGRNMMYYGMGTWLGQPIYGLTVFRVGHRLNISARDMLIAYVIGNVISLLVGWPVFLWISYTYGTLNMPGLTTAWSWGYGAIATIAVERLRSYFLPPWIPHAAAGFILALIFYYMSMRYVWWPLHPMGLWLGLGITSMSIGVGSACLFGYIVKRVILKVFGAKYFEETALPFLIGIVCGLMFTSGAIFALSGLKWMGVF
jgi:hypothetical protein